MTDHLADIEIQKRRFKIFIITDAIMVVIVLAGVFAEFAKGIEQARLVWGAAAVIGFAVQLWFVLGFRKSMKERGK